MRAFLFILVGFYSAIVLAASGDARAKWLNQNEMELQLPPGFYVSANTQFFLVSDTVLFSSQQAIELSFYSLKNGKALLGTNHISKEKIDQLIRGPLRVVVSSNNKSVLDSTSIQYAGLLDELYYSEAPLGSICSNMGCNLKLWAPTADSVRLLLYRDSNTPLEKAEVLFPDRDGQGVWQLELSSRYLNYYYQYEIRVYQPLTSQMQTYLVTDPYSFSLSQNGERSQLVDLDAMETRPAGWTSLKKPIIESLKDAVIYELHIRDYSSVDDNLPPEVRGTYLAFSENRTKARSHLKELAQAGLTYVHLLPFNDFGSPCFVYFCG